MRVTFALVAFTTLVALAPGSASARPLDIIRPEEVRPGMKGYALTVFQGTEPEPFEIEVVGRLEKAFPQQDIILIRATDEKLRDMKIVSGMSGSPVYVRDAPSGAREGGGSGRERPVRLMGAIAYSWSFQIEAIAGVTPITNMLGEEEGLRRAGTAPALVPAAGRGKPLTKFKGPFDYIGYERSRFATRRGEQALRLPAWAGATDSCSVLKAGSPQGRKGEPNMMTGALAPVTTPVMVSGVPARLFGELTRQLAPLGLLPLQGGGGGVGGGEGGGAGGEAKKGFRPGDAIGVQLMRGDSDWTAVGTVTHVDGKDVLAFGHAFLGAGPWEAPVTRADVQMILKRSSASFKLANSGPVVGKLVDDRQACIAAELGGRAGMVPVEVEVTGEGRHVRTFRYEIVRHPVISGMLTSWALVDSVHAAYPWREDATVTVRHRIEIEGQPPLEIKTIESTGGSFSQWMTRPVTAALYNPFERARLARLSYRVNVEPGNRSARILSVRTDAPEVKPGAEVTFYVKIRPFGGEDTELPFKLRVPAEPRTGTFSISFRSGAGVTPDIPTPRNLGEYLEVIRAHHTYSADELVAVYGRRTKGLMTEGKVLPALPASVVNVLAPAGRSSATTVADKTRIVKRTRWVLKGSASVSLILRE